MAKKILLAVGVLLLLVILGVVALFFVEIDSPELGRRVLEKASEASGVDLAAEGFRLNLRRGLILEDVTAAGRLSNGTYRLALDELVFEHRLLPLFRGKLEVERIRLEKPEIEVVTSKTTRPPARPSQKKKDTPAPEPEEGTGSEGAGRPESPASSFALEVSEIVLDDGKVSLRQEAGSAQGSQEVTLQGMDVEIHDLVFEPGAVSPLHAFSGEGRLAVTDAVLGDTRVSDIEGRMNASSGRFEMSNMGLTTPEGTFHGTMSVDFNSVPFVYELSLVGDPLDVNELAGVAEESFGPGHLRLDAKGFGSDSKNLEGTGVLKLDAGKLPAMPVLVKAEQALGRTQIAGSPYAATETPFRIRDNRVTIENFVFESEQAGLDLSGWLSIEGPVSLNLVIKTPRAGLEIKEVPNEVLDALTDDKGWVAVPLRVSGTREDPQVRPDVKALMARARQGTKRLLEETVKEKAGEKLKGLIPPLKP